MTQQQRRPRWRVYVIIAVVSPIVLLLLLYSPVFGSSIISRTLAYQAAPAPYPGSIEDGWLDGDESGNAWRKTFYTTTDSAERVYQYMNGAMPGFRYGSMKPLTGSSSMFGYVNQVCNESGVAQLIKQLIGSGPVTYSHCVTIFIYRDPKQPAMTRIVYWAEWPQL